MRLDAAVWILQSHGQLTLHFHVETISGHRARNWSSAMQASLSEQRWHPSTNLDIFSEGAEQVAHAICPSANFNGLVACRLCRRFNFLKHSANV